MPYLGEFYSLLTACLWSGSSIAFTAATRRIGSYQVNTSRLILAAGYLLILVFVAGLDVSLSIHQVIYLSISGFIGFALGDTFLFKAFELIGARISMLIMSLAPAVGALLAYVMLGENLSVSGVIGIVVTLAGICVVVLARSEDGTHSAITHHITRGGVALAVLAAIGQGGGLIVAKMAFREGSINGFVATLVRILASLVVLLPVSVMSGRYKRPVRVLRSDPAALKYTLLGSIFGPFLGVASSLMAIQYAKIGVAATIMATTPIVMLPIVRYGQKEHLSWRAIAGAFIATLGVGMLFLP